MSTLILINFNEDCILFQEKPKNALQNTMANLSAEAEVKNFPTVNSYTSNGYKTGK